MCDSTTSHRFTVANPQSFVGPSFSAAVQVDYLECTNLSTTIGGLIEILIMIALVSV